MVEAERCLGRGWVRIRREIRDTKYWDTVEVNVIGMEHNAPLASDLGLEHHCLTMSKLGGDVGQL